jgi:hypothetical protein
MHHRIKIMKIQKTRAIKHLKNIRMMTAITKNKWNIKMKIFANQIILMEMIAIFNLKMIRMKVHTDRKRTLKMKACKINLK